jgi:hypothetical protein
MAAGTVGIADKIAPGLLDRYLGRHAYETQQTAEPADPHRPDNLMQPVPGDMAPVAVLIIALTPAARSSG